MLTLDDPFDESPPTCLKICASFVGQRIGKLSRSRSVSTLKRAGVKCNGLVPSMDGVVVTVFNGAGLPAVIKSVFQFTNDVHPNNDKRGSLFDNLFLSIVRIGAEIIVKIVEVGLRSGKRGQNNLVRIVVLSVVVVIFFVHRVWAICAFGRLTLCRS